jgi:hypothetical protein
VFCIFAGTGYPLLLANWKSSSVVIPCNRVIELLGVKSVASAESSPQHKILWLTLNQSLCISDGQDGKNNLFPPVNSSPKGILPCSFILPRG